MKGRNAKIGLLAAVTVIVGGGGIVLSATQATANTSNGSIAVSTGMAAGMQMPDGTRMPSKSIPTGPPASARMVCSKEIRRDVATSLGLKTPPASTITWKNHLYTCTYHLSGGPIVFSVKDSGSVTNARAYSADLRQRLAPTRPLRGAIGLGLPAFETSKGNVIFLKDDQTLRVDATAMSSQVGPHSESRTTFAYQMATDVLGCWSGK